MAYNDKVVDAVINGISLLNDAACQINLVTITPLTKKRYLVEVAGTDGNRDLSDWFGAPRFESRILKIHAQCFSAPATVCADSLANIFAGKTVQVKLSFDDTGYRVGTVTQIAATGPQMSDEVVITIDCDPYRYAAEKEYNIPASSEAAAHIWTNTGTRDVIPEIVAEGDVTISCGTSKYSLTKGSYVLAGLAIAANSSITVEISGSAVTARYREAFL